MALHRFAGDAGDYAELQSKWKNGTHDELRYARAKPRGSW
jgi:hypothetical protein